MISKSIVTFTLTPCLKIITIKEIPSVQTAGKSCTIVTIIGEPLAAYQVVQYEYYGELYADATHQQWISRDNILIR